MFRLWDLLAFSRWHDNRFTVVPMKTKTIKNGFETSAMVGVQVAPGLMLVAGTAPHTYAGDGATIVAPDGARLWREPVGTGSGDDAAWLRSQALAGFAGTIAEVHLADLAKHGVSVI